MLEVDQSLPPSPQPAVVSPPRIEVTEKGMVLSDCYYDDNSIVAQCNTAYLQYKDYMSLITAPSYVTSFAIEFVIDLMTQKLGKNCKLLNIFSSSLIFNSNLNSNAKFACWRSFC